MYPPVKQFETRRIEIAAILAADRAPRRRPARPRLPRLPRLRVRASEA